MSYLILAIPVFLVVSALVDVRDRRRGRVKRSSTVMAAERRDLQSDMAATQHQGICVPIGDICRDRQRNR